MSKYGVDYSQRCFNVNRRAIEGPEVYPIGHFAKDLGEREKEEKRHGFKFSESSVLKILVQDAP
jgi:hypothetical protein